MVSPQELLNQIHATGIFILDPQQLNSMADRAEQAKQIRPELLNIRQQIETAQAECTPHDAPAYQLLNDITGQLEIALRAFVTDAEAKIPRYGTVFFERDGRWYIGTQQQAEDYRLEREAQALAKPMQNIEVALRDVRSKMKVVQRDLYRHDEAMRGLRPAIIGGLLVAGGLVGYVATGLSPLLVVAGAGLLLLIVSAGLYLRWRRRENELQQRMQALHQRGRELTQKQDALQARHDEITSKRRSLRDV